jgi:hypothetical protein
VRARIVPVAVSRILRASFWIAAVGVCVAVRAVALEPAALGPAPAANAAEMAAARLPDAPQPNVPADPAIAEAKPVETVSSVNIGTPERKLTTRELDVACQTHELKGKPCRVSWLPVLWESLESTAIENTGNIVFDNDTRDALTHNPYWSTYAKCVRQFRYDQWRDDDDFGVDYLGHGLQGGVVASLFEQNDPHGRGLVYVNNGNYWRSRLKGMAWIAVYEVQWKLGPAGEASVGSAGLNTYYTPRVKGRTTNETGFQDLVDTPIVGFWWNVGEDAIDRFVMPHIWRHTHNKLILSAAFVLTPCKGAANILRYKPLYYRDFPLTPVR